ncbi:hypothetical protein LCGC14_2674670 [marine sediment metagenome]|uniref:CBM-cenC domain-containing protein n=1 Tax=marine sediment metagenome TaxID=412755 RepID=A0A0F9BXZ7_9ZZZZ
MLGSVLRIPAAATVFLNTYEDNSWQRSDSAVETRVTQKTKTLGVDDAGLVFIDPTDHAITVTLPAPAAAKGLAYAVALHHYGYGLMANGDLEADEVPSMNGETPADTGNVTWSRSSVVARGGTYSGKMLTTDGATTNQFFHDAGADLHGLSASITYTLVVWTYVPTAGGLSALTEIKIYAYDVTNTTTLALVSPSLYDTWERHSLSFTIPASCAHLDLYLQITNAASANEFFYVDDIQLYRHYDVTVSGPIENVASYLLGDEGDELDIVSDGDKYLETNYTAHDHSGPDADGFWHRAREGDQLTHGHAVLVFVNSSTLAVAVTFLKNFVTNDYQVAIGGFIATTMTDTELNKLGALEIESKTVSGFTFTQHVDAAVVDADDTITFDYIAEGHWR